MEKLRVDRNPTSGSHRWYRIRLPLWKIAVLCTVSLAALELWAREKDATQYGMGLIVNLPFPEKEVAQVVQDLVQNGIIRGTKEYNKDEYVDGAMAVSSTKVFKEWTEGGQVFYKVRLRAIDPRNFKDSSDVGTLAVRYVVQAQGDKNTVLHIDAVFVEDYRKVSHPSNGSVEGAEYKDIHDHLDAIQSMKAQTIEAEKEKQERAATVQPQAATLQSSSQPVTPQPAPPVAQAVSTPVANNDAEPSPGGPTPDENSGKTLDQRAQELRRQVERRVKSPGAPLKSAPFHTASTLQPLPSGTEVMIVISTPYWVGVETHEGQHGWIMRDELELLP